MGYIENTKKQLLEKIEDLSQKLQELELLSTDLKEVSDPEDEFNQIATFLDILPGVIYQSTAETERKFNYLSPQCRKLTGYSKKQLLESGKVFFQDLIIPSDKQKIQDEIEKFIEDQNFFRLEYRIKRRDGSLIWIYDQGTGVHDEKGELKYITGFLSDITERKAEEKTKQRLLELEKALAIASGKLIKSKPDLDEVLTILGKAIDVDRAHIFGFYDERKYFKAQYEYFRKGVAAQKNMLENLSSKGFDWWMEKLVNRENIIIEDVDLLPPEAEFEKNVFLHYGVKTLLSVPVYTKDQGLKGFIAFSDILTPRNWMQYEIITLRIIADMISNYYSRQEYEDKILIAKEEAEKSEKLKSEFLAQISHEIRTPINVMLSFSSLLEEKFEASKSDPEIELSFNSIKNAGRRLIRTIDLLLNMSEVQAESYEYEPKILDLQIDILNNLKPEFTELARLKGIEIGDNFEISREYTIFGDEYTVSQILANLIDNAIKYTNKGRVELVIGFDENENCYVEVSDSGIGIAKQYIPELFEAFSQEDRGYTRKFEGSGLGLALVKKYCDLNKASIQVKSKKNEGSTFRVTFPKIGER